MLSPGWIVSHIVRLWIFIIPICLIIYYLVSSSQVPLPSIATIKDSPAKLYHAATTSNKDAFINSFIENEIDGSFNTAPLIELCDSIKWSPGLIMKCEPATGGIGNIRNIMLNCLRYAIEAGGSSDHIPSRRQLTYLSNRIPPPNPPPYRQQVCGPPIALLLDLPFHNPPLSLLSPNENIHLNQRPLGIPIHIPSPLPFTRALRRTLHAQQHHDRPLKLE